MTSPIKFSQTKKQIGFIINRSNRFSSSQQLENINNNNHNSRALSMQMPQQTFDCSRIISPPIEPTTHNKYHEDHLPGLIKHLHNESFIEGVKSLQKKNIETKDQQLYFNGDIYDQYAQIQRNIKFLELSNEIHSQNIESENYTKEGHLLQYQLCPEDLPTSLFTNKNIQCVTQNQMTSQELKKINIHDKFDLQNYSKGLVFLENIQFQLQKGQNKNQLLKGLSNILQFYNRNFIDTTEYLKLVQTKKQLIRNSFLLERLIMFSICFISANDTLQIHKKVLLNAINYSIENHLLILNLLTSQNSLFVNKIIKNHKKQFLKSKSFEYLRSTNQILHSIMHKIWKMDEYFYNGIIKILQNSMKMSIKSILYSIKQFFAFYLHAIHAQKEVYFLSVAPTPFIIEKSTHEYTLIIDTVRLFSSQKSVLNNAKNRQSILSGVKVRPYTQYFLKEMSKYYEIISFSHCMPLTCNNFIAKIDQKHCIKHKLYKYHTDNMISGGKNIKKIGRNLEKTIILDATNIMDNIINHNVYTEHDLSQSNTLMISSWSGQKQDAELAQICPLLAMIAIKRLEVESCLGKIRRQIKENWANGIFHINCGIHL